MSDGITDSYRDQERAEKQREMWKAIGAFAEAPSPERRQAALEAAEAADSIRGGYWTSRTKYRARIMEKLDGLERGDRGQWALLILNGGESDPAYAEKLQSKSPLRDCLIGCVDQRGNGLNIEGPMARALLQQLPGRTGHPQPFLVIFPKSAAEITTL